jgi:endogenous inhibitor of DNA gyrase (YacG/DUF329 family)
MPEARRTASPCPICGKPAVESARPFCSRRCADVDLGRWFTEQYSVPAAPDDTDDDTPPSPARAIRF